MTLTKKLLASICLLSSLCWGLFAEDIVEYYSPSCNLSVYNPPIILKKGVIDNEFDKAKLPWFSAYNAYSRISDFKDKGYEEWKNGFSSDFLKDFPINKELFTQYLQRGPSDYQNPEVASVVYAIEIDSKYILMAMVHNGLLTTAPMEPIANATVTFSFCYFVKEDSSWKFTRKDYYNDINFSDYMKANINELIEQYKLTKRD